ncbi:hypothetical protein A2Z33_02960 [Candidatus Gottesmanbacteria bacterium RBG_16_52_11]|uniref:Membrane protein 6-pyruvoyl-tetrahydropterin synthase-related domain-containing protein n=1 Tax=Candidatus Gottesmanbacteria bacterium RBG_16_52_11 TaxID=1798374 RepID=A0A1F5YN02_9BACT|nr:MAG: hypothetical protein A2Z33_02960 [Candidatus Gottesmanbacteria bacterium RBG_16_52_11]
MGKTAGKNRLKKITGRLMPAILPAVLIAGAWLFFARPYLTAGLIPFPGDYLVSFFPPWNAAYGMPVKNAAMPDIITQIYPWKTLTMEAWKSGQIPLWNPYAFSGTPHAANYQSAVFSPLNLLYGVLPMADAWSISVLLQPILAAVFMFMFLRSLGISGWSGATGSLAFMFSGFLVGWMGYATLGYALLFLPLSLYGVRRYLDTGRPAAALLVTAAISLSLLSGHFQISIYTVIFSLAYILYAGRNSGWRTLAILLLHAAGGIGIAAPQLFLTYRAFADSTRSASAVPREIIPWQYLVTLFAPDFYGNPVTRNDWFGHYAEWASSIGTIPLVLVFTGGMLGTVRRYRFFWAAAFLALFLAYDTPLSALLFILKLPVLSSSAAGRIIGIMSFSLAVLAAAGMDAVRASGRNDLGKFVRIAVAATLMLLVIWSVVTVFPVFSPERTHIALRNLVLPTILTVACLTALIAGAVRVPKSWITVTLCIVAALELLRFSLKWMPYAPRSLLYPETGVLKFLRARAGNDRIFGNIGSEVGTTFRLQLIEGYDALYQGRYGQFINSASAGRPDPGGRSVVSFDKHGTYRDRMMSLLGVRYLIHRLSDGRSVWAYPYWDYPAGVFTQVYRDDQYWVYEYKDALPRASLMSDFVLRHTDQEIVGLLLSADFPYRDAVILETDPGLQPEAGPGSASITQYSPNSVTVTTQSDADKILLLSDTYDTGWRASIDGRQTPVLRADYDLRAVAVPAGRHTVEFKYLPEEFLAGSALAAATAVLLTGYHLRRAYANRHR